MRTAHYCLVFLFVSGCTTSGGKTGTLVSDTTFINLYADKLIVTEESNITGADSAVREHRLDSLYRKYGTTPEKVGTSVTNLQQNPATWKEFYDHVVRRIEVLQQQEPSTPRPTEKLHENDPHRR
jgi:hypothetical protein